MFRRYARSAAVIALAVLVAPGAPFAQEDAPAVPGRTVVETGDGTVILMRAGEARQNGGVWDENWTAAAPALPDESMVIPEFLALTPAERVYLAGGQAPVSLDRPAGKVIGRDDRKRVRKTNVYPARAATFIWIETGRLGEADTPEASRCSGAIVGAANLVITAAHCVFNPDTGRWYSDWTIYPGAKSASQTPYGSCSWRRVYVDKKWQKTGRAEYDVAAIVMNCTVGNRTGWLGAGLVKGSGFSAGNHRIHQYPGDKPLATQWLAQGPWAAVDSKGRRAYYTMDTAAGSSGSAVMRSMSDGYWSRATHAYGASTYNSGALWWKRPWKKVFVRAHNWATRVAQ